MKLQVCRSFYYVLTGTDTRRTRKAIEVPIVGCDSSTLLDETGSGARKAKVETGSRDWKGAHRLCACSPEASENCI